MPNYFFIATILLLPLQFALNIGDNVDLVTTRILIPVIFLLWLGKSFSRKEIWVPNKTEMWLILTFLFLSVFSLYLGRDAGEGLRKVLYFLTIFPIFFVAADIFREEKWRKKATVAVVASGMLAAIFGLVQFALPFFIGTGKTVLVWENLAPFFLGNSFGKVVAANSSWLVNIGGQTRMRAFAFFPDPHMFSFFVSLCFFAALGYFFETKKAVHKFLAGAGLILMIAALGFSFSRGAYLGAIAGFLFFTLVFLKRSGVSGKFFVAIGAVFILLIALNFSGVSQRFSSSFSSKEGSNAERIKNWSEAIEVIRDYPLGGVGLGNYSRTIDPSAGQRSSIYAHNLYLDIAAETGILSVLVFLFLIFISLWRNIISKSFAGLGFAAGLVAFSIHSLFDTALYSPQVMAIFLVMIAIGLSANSKFKIQSAK